MGGGKVPVPPGPRRPGPGPSDSAFRPILLNRVDLCVSGVVVFSRTPLGRRVWDEMNGRREVKKEYLALSEKRINVGVKKVLMCTNRGQGRLPTGGKGKVLLR